MKNPDIPIDPLIINQPMSNNNQFVRFTHTDLKKDLAQTTVPYLDAQPVIPKVPVPLSGAGIFYKGFPGYGGFVALNILTYDYSRHMEQIVFNMLEKNFGSAETNYNFEGKDPMTKKAIEYNVDGDEFEKNVIVQSQ